MELRYRNSSSQEENVIRERAKIASYAFRAHVWKGCDLVIKDSTGASDPYVNVRYEGKLIFKSRKIMKNLNPEWDEHFDYVFDDLTAPLVVEVFDFDRFGKDDFMGSAIIDLSTIECNKIVEVKLMLQEDNSDAYMGYLIFKVSLTPITAQEQEQFQNRGSIKKQESLKSDIRRIRKGHQVPEYLLNIVLAEGKNLLVAGMHRSNCVPPDPYVKFKLGTEKQKSKAALKTYSPKWSEQFHFRTFCDGEQKLELLVVDKKKDDIIGRCDIDINSLQRGITHQEWYDLDADAGKVLLFLTLSSVALNAAQAERDMLDVDNGAKLAELQDQYSIQKTLDNMEDVGFLHVKVFKAQGLTPVDITNTSDPFCILELVNSRLQTSVIRKSLDPEWNQYFTFQVKDIHSVLEVSVYDDNQIQDPQFLGKLGVPLLKIRDGQRRWYALKDHTLTRRAKGQILMEMKLVWNPVRASVRTFKPRERKYMDQGPKFNRRTLVRNLNRVTRALEPIGDATAFVQSCFTWESPARSLVAFITFLVVTYYWKPYMLPLFLLALFAKSYMMNAGMLGPKPETNVWNEDYIVSSDEDEEKANNESAKSASITQRLRSIQDSLLQVQNSLDFIASTLERVKNTFNFTQPFLSVVAIVVFSVATVLVYFVPLRFIVMAWGINKFTKRFRKGPYHIPNNEVLDFLSRVFSDIEMRMYGEFQLLRKENSTL